MSTLQTFQVFPSIPEPLAFIETLSRNIWWSWQYEAVELFRRVDPRLWDKAGRNPLLFSTLVPQARMQELAKDKSFLANLERVKEKYERLVCQKFAAGDIDPARDDIIAYFSMEFGIHESIPLFAGGLGILAGDHLKAASDMALPLVGVGLLYRQGYFRQFLDQTGWQQEEYPDTDLYQLPVERVHDRSGNELFITVEGPDGDIRAAVWRIPVGCIPLFLLDTNLVDNPPHIRGITARLYAGESEIRMRQEILLGVGGMRALAALDIFPSVCHMNEGHSTFMSVERLHHVMKRYDVDVDTALEIVPRTTVFTTHTPVAAGHDEFPPDMVRPFLKPIAEKLGLSTDAVLAWGRESGAEPEAKLSMFILGMRMARYINGVSKLHGEVARRMWTHLWSDRPDHEVPISHVTNGVHIPSFLSHENSILFERYLGPDWTLKPSTPDFVGRIEDIYDEELWRAHCMSRSHLIRTCRKQMVSQYQRRAATRVVMKEAELVLDQDILTIAFARRFATYKRANLLLRDPERLEAIITSDAYPVQFIFAGKAHPQDNEGKELIRRLVEFGKKKNIRHRFVFIEDYDIHLARHLVHGADVWLNTPRRPFEACGTSGMKAAINGVLNLSVLDGWWCEGYGEDRGWRIGNGEEYNDPDFQDEVESQALYNVLENDVIPCFYERKNGDIPLRWLKMMKSSMKMAIRVFCAHRMVAEYDSRFYGPGRKNLKKLTENHASFAKHLCSQQQRLVSYWNDIRVEEVVRDEGGAFRVGDKFHVRAVVSLGELKPEEIEVEFNYGRLKTVDSLVQGYVEPMFMKEDLGQGRYLYECEVNCHFAGRYGFTVRVTPHGDEWVKFTPGFIKWA